MPAGREWPTISPTMTTHALEIVRSVVATFERPAAGSLVPAAVEDPAEDPETVYDVVPADSRTPYDVREVIRRIVDGSRMQEFKQLYAAGLVAGSRGGAAAQVGQDLDGAWMIGDSAHADIGGACAAGLARRASPASGYTGARRGPRPRSPPTRPDPDRPHLRPGHHHSPHRELSAPVQCDPRMAVPLPGVAGAGRAAEVRHWRLGPGSAITTASWQCTVARTGLFSC